MKKNFGGFRMSVAFAVLALSATGCGGGDGETARLVGPGLICAPFMGDLEYSDRGVYGQIYQFDSPIMQASTSISDLQARSNKMNANVVMSNMNVPTSRFNIGFPLQGGGKLMTPWGTILTEYFSLHLESEIRLSDTDEEGFYQFATISDDGIKVQIKENDAYRVLISDETPHQTGMACSNEGIFMTKDTKLPIMVDYFQGPREHLTMMVIWRKVGNNNGTATGLSEAVCGTRGNELFFDASQTPSAPQPLWTELEGRGWKPVANDNFYLPAGVGSNPCLK